MDNATKTAPVTAQALVTFVPYVSFTGFPNDIKTKFTAGVESAPIPADYLELLRAKGLVREPAEPNEGKTVAHEAEQPIDDFAPKRKVKLSSLKANLQREKQGDWIPYPDWPGVEFNVSALNSPEYETARQLMFQRLNKTYKNSIIPQEVMTVELGELYCEYILHGWRGLDVDYSPELAHETLTDPEHRPVVSAIEYCAAKLSQIDIEFMVAEQGKLLAAFRNRLRRSEAAQYMDWLAELAEEFPDEAWLQPVDDGEEQTFEPRIWHDLYFQAFDALRYDRPYGALGGQMPISYLAISTYAHDHGITGNDFGRFCRMLNRIDETYLAHTAEVQKQKQEGGER